MEMNWSLKRRAPQLKLAACNFPNPADLRVITVFQWCSNALRAVPNWQATFRSYFITALIVMQITCKLSGFLRCSHLLHWIPQTWRENFYLFIYFYIFPYVKINLNWFSPELITVYFFYWFNLFLIIIFMIIVYIIYFTFHFSDLEFAKVILCVAYY